MNSLASDVEESFESVSLVGSHRRCGFAGFAVRCLYLASSQPFEIRIEICGATKRRLYVSH